MSIITDIEDYERGDYRPVKECRLSERMAATMRKKLELNRHKGTWEGMSYAKLFRCLRQEVDELEACFTGEDVIDPDNVWPEAADVANFAAMIADKSCKP